MSYERRVSIEIEAWEHRLLQKPGFFEKASNKLSAKINGFLPQRLHDTITAAVKTIVRTALFGAEYTPKGKVNAGIDLAEADMLAEQMIKKYQRIAAAEGAGTGAGGGVLSVADFPLLIGIKMKFLFEMAHLYGYFTSRFDERIYLLLLFQLTYANRNRRSAVYASIRHWPETRKKWPSEKEFYKDMDWEQFQKDYRDALDFRKMLQFIPGIGAVAGAWANFGILQEIGETAKNGYRMRLLHDRQKRFEPHTE